MFEEYVFGQSAPQNDRPGPGAFTRDCMNEVLYEMTRYQLQNIPVQMLDDWLLAAVRAMNALPTEKLRNCWGSMLATRMIAHVEAMAALGLDAVLDLHDSGTGSASGYQRPATIDGVRLLVAEGARRGWQPIASMP